MKSATTLLASALQLSSLAFAADKAAWKSRNIYFALTDRIARGSDDTGGNACSDLGSYCGGTFAGLQSKLEYIQGLGFDAIWITPVVSNADGGYHGYWATDLYSVNENLGSAQDLKNLVNAAHEKDIYIMVDVVANHMGEGDIANFKPEPLNQQSSYHSNCQIDYEDQSSVETCRIASNLPDVKTNDENIRSTMQEWVSWLIQEYGFDGVRIDTVKHVEKDFWPGFSSATGTYTIGEVFDGDVDYLAGYDGLMGGLLDYATYYPMNRFYQQQGSSQDLVDMINTVGESFADPAALGTFLDNHDNARWLNSVSDTTLLKNALAFVILSRGIPIVYYGTEQGYSGGSDPENREDLWRSNFNTNSDLYKFISSLNSIRADAGLDGNDHTHLYVADSAYAFSRSGGDLIVLTTNGGEGTGGEHCFGTKVNNGSWDIVSGGEGSVSSDGSGQVCVTVNSGLPVVLSASG